MILILHNNELQKSLFTLKYYEFVLKISEKHTKRVVTSFSYMSLNSNFYILYKMMTDF